MTHLSLPFQRRLCIAALACASMFAAPAQAQLFGGDDEARQAILKLRQDLDSMRAEGQRGRLQLANQIETQQRQIMQMRGQIEALEKQVSDLQRGTSLASSSEGNTPAGSPAGAASAEQAAYDKAIEIFRDGKYADAAAAMSAFVQQYPNSALAPSAQFYWGSSLYATKEYRSAIQRLEAMVSSASRHPRAADALLVIAGCQIELNDRNAARTTLQRITRDYPDTPAATTARDRLQLLS